MRARWEPWRRSGSCTSRPCSAKPATTSACSTRGSCGTRDPSGRRCARSDPQVVGLSAITIEARVMEQMARVCREELPEVPIMVGGPHATAYPHRCARNPRHRLRRPRRRRAHRARSGAGADAGRARSAVGRRHRLPRRRRHGRVHRGARTDHRRRLDPVPVVGPDGLRAAGADPGDVVGGPPAPHAALHLARLSRSSASTATRSRERSSAPALRRMS